MGSGQSKEFLRTLRREGEHQCGLDAALHDWLDLRRLFVVLGFELAKQALHHLSHAHSPFCFSLFFR
jgi:hypothetical protein